MQEKKNGRKKILFCSFFDDENWSIKIGSNERLINYNYRYFGNEWTIFEKNYLAKKLMFDALSIWIDVLNLPVESFRFRRQLSDRRT